VRASKSGSVSAIGQDAAVRAQLAKISAVPSTLAGAEFGNFIKSEVSKWGPVVEKAGITAQ
jgi:tripartite-type tricarboxylate transporter receptor subunit TctC